MKSRHQALAARAAVPMALVLLGALVTPNGLASTHPMERAGPADRAAPTSPADATVPVKPEETDRPQAPEPGEELQGVWRGTETGNPRVWTLQVKGTDFRFDGPGPQEYYEGTMTVSEGTPSGIDLHILRCDCIWNDSVSLGLVQVNDDRLTFVGAEPGYDRPEGFDLKGRSMQMHMERLPPPD